MARKKIYANQKLMEDLMCRVENIISNQKRFSSDISQEERILEMKNIKALLYCAESFHLCMEKEHRKNAYRCRMGQAKLREIIEAGDSKEFLYFLDREVIHLK